MTQDERRKYLIQYLLKEEMKFVRQSIPTDKQGQENLLRSLMNVRPPRPISNDFLKIQDEYLTERNIERGITDVDTLYISFCKILILYFQKIITDWSWRSDIHK